MAAGAVGVWEWNLVTGEIYVDPLVKGRLGYQDHEVGNHAEDWSRLLHPDDLAVAEARATAHIRGETPVYEAEHRMLHRDGSMRWFLARGAVVRDDRGTAISMAGTLTDITDWKRSEAALRHAEELNRTIVENTSDCVKILSLDGRLLYVNAVGLRQLDLTDAAPLLNQPLAGFFEGDVRRAAEHAIEQARLCGRGQFQYPLGHVSGRAKWWDAVLTPIIGADGTVSQLLGVSREITDRRREELFRAAQHQLLEMIAIGTPLLSVLDSVVRLVESQFDGLVCTVLLLDDDGVTVRHGAAPSLPPEYVAGINGLTIGPRAGSCGTAMYRGERVVVPDILTDPLWDGYRDGALAFGLRACWSTPIFSPQRKVLGSLAMYYREPRSPGPEELWLIETAADLARIAIEQQRAYLEADAHRRELAHLNRVAMLGEMSGALAHELSQPLTAVLSNAYAARYLLDRDPLDVEELRRALDDIIKNDKRAGAVIDHLRTLLRKGETTQRHAVDVNDLTREVIELASGELHARRVQVKSTLPPAMPSVLGDRVQLQQVVLNLVLNACDAMSGTDVNRRQIALATTSDGGFVQLAVSDQGPGIPDGQLLNVFEPFVTFREQGLGLGLAISRSILSAHGGSIQAENNAGGGATFRCFLPVAGLGAARPPCA